MSEEKESAAVEPQAVEAPPPAVESAPAASEAAVAETPAPAAESAPVVTETNVAHPPAPESAAVEPDTAAVAKSSAPESAPAESNAAAAEPAAPASAPAESNAAAAEPAAPASKPVEAEAAAAEPPAAEAPAPEIAAAEPEAVAAEPPAPESAPVEAGINEATPPVESAGRGSFTTGKLQVSPEIAAEEAAVGGEMNVGHTEFFQAAESLVDQKALRQAAMGYASDDTVDLEAAAAGSEATKGGALPMGAKLSLAAAAKIAAAAAKAHVTHDDLVRIAKKHQARQACTTWEEQSKRYRWTPICGTGPAKLGKYGDGIQMYFEFLRLLGILFFILFVINSPLLALSALGSFIDEDNFLYKLLASISVGNLGTCPAGGCKSWDDVQNRLLRKGNSEEKLRDWTWLLGLLDAASACVVLAFGVWLSIFWLPRQRRKAAGRHIAASRFAVKVQRLPSRIEDHAQYEQKLKDHFNQMLQDPRNDSLIEQKPHMLATVSEVVLVRDYSRAIGKFGEYGQLLLNLENLEVGIKQAPTEQQAASLKKSKEALERQIEPLEKVLEQQMQMTDDARDVCGAYVMFKYEEWKDLILHKYRLSTTPFFRLCQKKKRCFSGKPIKVEQACDPSDIFWENLDCKFQWRILRRSFTNVFTLLGLLICALLTLLCVFYSAELPAIPSQEVWVIRNAADGRGVVNCWQVCDWQLYKDISCREQLDDSSFTAFDMTGQIKTPSSSCSESVSSIFGYTWQSPSCRNLKTSADSEWIFVKFNSRQTVQCMKLDQLLLNSVGVQTLEVFACNEAALPTSLANYSTWRPEEHCAAMNDIVPKEGEIEAVDSQFENVITPALPITPGDCSHAVAFDVAKRAETAAKDDGRAPESDSVVACFCTQKYKEQGSLFLLPPFNTPEKEFCYDWVVARNIRLAKLLGSSLLVLTLNYVLMLLIRFLVQREKHSSATDLCVSQMVKLFVAIFVNTGLLTLLINANVRGHLDSLPVLGAILFKGNFHDFDADWFTSVGSSLVLTMALQIVSTTTPFPLWSFVVHPLMIWWYKKSNYTQQMMNQLYILPDFEFAYRMAQTMNVAFVTLMFSGGMPILHLLAALYCLVAYWADKWCLLHGSRKPPAYDDSIFIVSAKLFYIGSFLHVIIAALIYGNQTIFPSNWGKLQDLVGSFIDMTKDDYEEVMSAYFVGTEETRDKLFDRYWQARMFDLGRNANLLLFVMLVLFLAYFAIRIAWYWILRPLLGPLVLSLRECIRKCEASHIGAAQTRCKDPLDAVKKRNQEKGETQLMSYQMKEHPQYSNVYFALSHERTTRHSMTGAAPVKALDADVDEHTYI